MVATLWALTVCAVAAGARAAAGSPTVCMVTLQSYEAVYALHVSVEVAICNSGVAVAMLQWLVGSGKFFPQR